MKIRTTTTQDTQEICAQHGKYLIRKLCSCFTVPNFQSNKAYLSLDTVQLFPTT